MEETVAIVGLAIMAVGLITVVVGLTQFIKMLAPPESAPPPPPGPPHELESSRGG